MTAPSCSIHDDRLRLEWPDRHLDIDGELLRRHCRCAECRSLQLRGLLPNLAGTTVRAVVPMGYGVQLRFSDGHERGIFPWTYLTALAAAR